MVIEDLSVPGTEKNRTENGRKGRRGGRRPLCLASPVDRLAAVVTDLVLVILPISAVLGAPFKQGIMKALVLQDETDFYFFLFLLFVTSACVVIAYQTAMVSLWGATLGKMFWGLRVEWLWKRRNPSFSMALLRSVFWIVDSVFLFVPHLSVFANEKRRPFHDRISDTVVVTTRGGGVRTPGMIEASFVHGVGAALAVFGTLFMGFSSIDLYMRSKGEDSLFGVLKSERVLCDAVGVAMEDWPSSSSSSGESLERLSVAMALFASGEISAPCLRSEVEDSLVRQGIESPMAYLAQSFVYSDSAELSDRYLDQVCKLDMRSDSCKMSRIVEMWMDEDWTKIDDLFNELNHTKEPYILTWAVRHFMRRENFQMALSFLDKMGPSIALGSFVGIQRTKAYWNLSRKEEARAAADIAINTMGPANRIDLASWLCKEEIDENCAGVSRSSCLIMNKILEKSDEYLADRDIALTYIKNFECDDTKGKSYDELKREVSFPEGRQLIGALTLIHGSAAQEGRRELWKLAQDKKASENYREEARHYLASSAQSSFDLEALYSEWKHEVLTPHWRKRGERLFNNYYRLKNFDRSWEIGQTLVKDDGGRIDSKTREEIIVAGFKVGEMKSAYLLMKELFPSQEKLTTGRHPASGSQFELVSRSLIQEFKNK
ncbi:MAG: RDD family protein [Bdellovibrionales bacterium]|nr:RDD family protein [Bdellovibrionales bacterium]